MPLALPQEKIDYRPIAYVEECSADWWKRGEARAYAVQISHKNEDIESKLANEFKLRLKEWNEDTKIISSTSRLYSHPAYQRIVGMGKPAIKYVLKELQNDSGRWFHALKYMAGMDVAAGCKNYQEAKEAWLKWGRDNDHI